MARRRPWWPRPSFSSVRAEAPFLIVLGSASPRRAHILTALGIPFRLRVADVDEVLAPGEEATVAAERLARAKAEAVVASLAAEERAPVLAADTLVVCDGRVLGKPRDGDDAAAMLRLLSARTHEVVTGVCVSVDGVARSAVERTAVTFAALSEAEIAWYVATGEPMDKAGGYHVDGRGALFITGIAGSPSNVAGLPVRLVLRLLREAGVSLSELGGAAPHPPDPPCSLVPPWHSGAPPK